MAIIRKPIKKSDEKETQTLHDDEALWLPVANSSHSIEGTKAYFTSDPELDADFITFDDSQSNAYEKYYAAPTLAGRLSMRLALVKDHFFDLLIALYGRERDRGAGFIVFTLLFGVGIITYFTLDREPNAIVLGATVCVLAAILIKKRNYDASFGFLAVLFAVSLGMGAAQFKTMTALSPAIHGQITANVSGLIMEREIRANGSVRYLVAPRTIEGIAPDQLPQYVRISARKLDENLYSGKEINGLARLRAYAGPPYPGGYDFSFLPRFEGIGGSGFFMGAPKQGDGEANPSLLQQVSMGIAHFRQQISHRIRSRFTGKSGEFAVALITGERSGLDEQIQESLRKSGLAHILAISGLHMGLVTLTIIAIIRRLLSISPNLAQTRPIRKYAAFAGFCGATAYLALSGNSIASQRAWIMISVMLLAMMCDRRAFTLRSVAIAAMIILLFSPQSVFSAGFQMSFAAVAALVAVYDLWLRFKLKTGSSRIQQLAGIKKGIVVFFSYMTGLAMTSIVAGAATGIFAAYHFHRVALLGLVANLIAMPVVSFLVMPSALLAMLAMPYGFDAPFFAAMGMGIDQVMAVSDYVNSLGSDRSTGALAPQFLWFGAAGLVILVCLTTRLRAIGAGLLVLAFFAAKPLPKPDILISEDGRVIGISGQEILAESSKSKSSKASFVYPYPRRGKFITEIWDKAWPISDTGSNAETATKTVSIKECGKDQCQIELGTQGKKERSKVSLVYNPDMLPEACESADILIAPRLKWVRCIGERIPTLILKRENFENRGSMALYRQGTESDWLVKAAINGHQRPWSRPQITYQN